MNISVMDKSSQITVSNVNTRFCVTLKHVFELLQDIATEHATQLGFGWEVMNSQGKVWVLSKMCVDFYQSVQLYDTINLTTYPTVPSKFFAGREFIAHNSKGEKVFGANSRWCLLDVVSRKILNPNSIEDVFMGQYQPSANAVSDNTDRLTLDDSYTLCYDKVVRISDLDMNNHVNNTNYVNYAKDCFTADMIDKQLKRVEVVYHSEAKLNDTIHIFSKVCQDSLCVIGKVQDKICFTTKMFFV